MEEERERQESCIEEPTRLSSDTVKAARGGVYSGTNSEEKGLAEPEDRGEVTGDRLPSWESPCHP